VGPLATLATRADRGRRQSRSRRAMRRPRPLLALRRRPRLRQAVAAATGLAVALGVHGAITGAQEARDRWGTEVAVLVARADLPVGHVLGPADTEVRALPAALVPRGAITGSSTGRVVRHPVVEGEPLVATRLAPEGLTGVAALLPEGTVAVAVPTDPATTPPLEVGDRVDVLVAPAPASVEGPPPVRAASGATVVAVGEVSATVAVPTSRAPTVAFAAGTGAVALALVAA
jgi:pilus assembly protein CpaB